ncbi:hypothetical protein FACS189426_16830 [Bacteroidia bacterium]|nr:hypothetical protein FACS189426_16830 [Bacteroidia bacterium]
MQLHKLINRLQFIHRSIQQESTGKPKDFAKQLSISKRQFYNIKEELIDYGADIKYNRFKNTYYYVNDFEINISIGLKSDNKKK